MISRTDRHARPVPPLDAAALRVLVSAEELPWPAATPHHVAVACLQGRTGAARSRLHPSLIGCAVASSRETARVKAIAELLERYSASQYDPRQLIHGRHVDLSVEAVHPSDFAMHSESQLMAFRERNFARPESMHPQAFTAMTKTGWATAQTVDAGRRGVLVPAPFVFLPYRYPPDEPYFVDCLTTGLACERTWEAATLAGLREVIERDAIAIRWLLNIQVPRIQPTTAFVEWSARMLPSDVVVTLLDATLDVGLHVVIAMLQLSEGGVVIGVAAHLSMAVASQKATLEATQALRFWRRRVASVLAPERPALTAEEVVTFVDHQAFYLEPRNAATLGAFITDHFVAMTHTESPSEQEELAGLVAVLAALGHSVLAITLTRPELEPLGLTVVRVIVPGLQPLHARHTAPWLGGERLARFAATHGTRINPAVHPFP